MRLLFILFLFFHLCSLQAESRQHQPFVVVTPEKTGTHLLLKALSRMLDKDFINCWSHDLTPNELSSYLDLTEQTNSFFHIHALPTPNIVNGLKQRGYKVIFLMRDPRDVIVSLYYYIEKGWSYGPFNNKGAYGKLSSKEKLDELITGSRYKNSALKSIIGRRMPWLAMSKNFVYTARFENLVGQKGGGSDEAQFNEIIRISNFIGVQLTNDEITSIAQDLFGQTGKGTFRKGMIGDWKNVLDASQQKAVLKVFGKELKELGYK